MKVKSTHYILILVSFLVLAGSIYAYWLVYLKIVKQAGHSANIAVEVEKAEGKKNREQSIIRLHEKTVADRMRIKSMLIPENSIIEFINKIEKTGRDSGSKLEIVSLDKSNEGLKSVVKVSGSWNAVIKTLISIENLPLAMELKDMRLDKSEEGWILILDIFALTSK